MTTKGVPKINIEDENAPLIVVFPDTMVNEKFKDRIIKRIKANNGYCPCVEKAENTFCPCEEYLNTHNCHCNLYIKKT
jgi:ferredoxin-thioredoxin reductase catalytic subunit